MGWEDRNGRQYYYRKKRINGRVKSEYVGSGILGQACQDLDQSESGIKAIERAALQAEKEQAAELDQKINQNLESIQGVIEQVLQGWGYRKVKGEWRKKRS